MRDNTSNWNGCYKISNPTLLFLFIIGVIYELGNLNILKPVHNEHPVPSNTIMLNFNLNIFGIFDKCTEDSRMRVTNSSD